jgi:RsmE family RNA methyltransferase
LIDRSELSADGDVVLTDERATHMRNVWKIAVDSDVRVGCIDGPLGRGRVVSIEGDRVRVRCTFSGDPPPRPPIDLVLAAPRPKVLKRLWAQLAAIGVGTIVVTNASRVERYYFDSHALDPNEVRARLCEGLAQARDTRVPIVHVRTRLKPFVEDELDEMFGDARRLLADPAYARSPIDAVSHSGARRIVLALGPEGGWTPYERDLLERSGFLGIGLGARSLRSDTAVIALLSMIHECQRRS